MITIFFRDEGLIILWKHAAKKQSRELQFKTDKGGSGTRAAHFQPRLQMIMLVNKRHVMLPRNLGFYTLLLVNCFSLKPSVKTIQSRKENRNTSPHHLSSHSSSDSDSWDGPAEKSQSSIHQSSNHMKLPLPAPQLEKIKQRECIL